MDIYILKIDEADKISENDLIKFNKKKMTHNEKLKAHCFVYYMTDKILKDIYNIHNTELEFIKNKPYLKTREKFISLSHSDEFAVLVVSNSECGCDIEKIKKRNFKKIADYMKFKSETLQEFYKDWTKFEASYKMGMPVHSEKTILYNNYSLSVVSSVQETFDFYIQTGTSFSKYIA